MAVTITETRGHVAEMTPNSPLGVPVTMDRNGRSRSPKYALALENPEPGTFVRFEGNPVSSVITQEQSAAFAALIHRTLYAPHLRPHLTACFDSLRSALVQLVGDEVGLVFLVVGVVS